MQRLFLILIMFAVCLVAPAQRNNRRQQQRRPTQKEQLQEKQRRLRQQQQQNKKRQQELEKQVRQRMQDVEALASDIDDKQAVIAGLKIQIDSVNNNICELDSQLVILQDELEDRRQHYVQSVRYMYRNRNVQNKLMFVLSAKNANQMYRRMRFMKEYTTHQRAQAEAVKQKSEQVAVKLSELDSARTCLNTLLAKSSEEQRQLESKKNEQQRLVADLQKEQQTVKKLIVQQQQEEAELNRQIDKIIAEELEKARKAEEERQRRLAEQRRREQEQRAQEQRTQANNNSNSRNNRNNNRGRTTTSNSSTSSSSTATGSNTSASAYHDADPDRRLSGSFAGNKGRLPVPITGSYKVIRGFGSYTMAGVTLQSSGLHLEGQAGAKARCVFEGEVSKVYNPGSGYFVMVRHGRYISVYGNLASVDVTVGQHVSTNQTLGTVGTNHVLVFRLQNWDKLLNPKPWISRL